MELKIEIKEIIACAIVFINISVALVIYISLKRMK